MGAAYHKGRGATLNMPGRFERAHREPEAAFAHERRRTRVGADRSKTIIATNTSPDVGFDRSINTYRGCEHGCIYCYARPTHAYLGLSPGLDFETELVAKHDAAVRLEAAFRQRGYRPAPLQLGGVTDVYQPVERELRITRRVLEVLLAWRHPVQIVTKSASVLRDLDLLAELAALGLAVVDLSVTTLDGELARRLEPRASAPHRRLDAIAALADAGVPTGVAVAPVIPGLTCHELEAILRAAAEVGAVSASWVLLRLPHELRELFDAWLAEHRPERRARVLSLVRQSRGGRLNDAAFGTRMTGEGPIAELVAARFAAGCRRFGLAERDRRRLRADRFGPPEARAQADLFAAAPAGAPENG
ncbi:MAG: PA0069 family radical SAM protein [Alphaproteobacteria bacterium]|jgi:DNA repair photolyase|nr:PA0069 family radical SAM protein [Alphaproteobacteria bacterium]